VLYKDCMSLLGKCPCYHILVTMLLSYIKRCATVPDFISLETLISLETRLSENLRFYKLVAQQCSSFCAPPTYTNIYGIPMQNSMTLGETFLLITHLWKPHKPKSFRGFLHNSHRRYPNFLSFFIEGLWILLLMVCTTVKSRNSSRKT